MKTTFTAAILAGFVIFGGCASTPESIAEYKARKGDTNSVVRWKPNPYAQVWTPASPFPQPEAPKEDTQDGRRVD